MPVQPKPFKVECQNCGYSKIISPKSDVLIPFDTMTECPKCAYEMKVVKLNVLERILNLAFNFRKI